MKTRRLQGKTEGANGGSVQRLVRRGRGDIRALNLCVDALDGCTSIRMVKATLDFMTDRYLTHPSPQLPEHLRRETPNDPAQRQPPESAGGAHARCTNHPRLPTGKRGGCSLQRSG